MNKKEKEQLKDKVIALSMLAFLALLLFQGSASEISPLFYIVSVAGWIISSICVCEYTDNNGRSSLWWLTSTSIFMNLFLQHVDCDLLWEFGITVVYLFVLTAIAYKINQKPT